MGVARTVATLVPDAFDDDGPGTPPSTPPAQDASQATGAAAGTEYTVLQLIELEDGAEAWFVLGHARATNDRKAIEAVAGDGKTGHVAVPSRSWRPRVPKQRTIWT